MFFIVPSPAPDTTPIAPHQSASSDEQQLGDVDAYYRRRVAAACDRCRLKKARCSGGPAPCNKCKRDRVICIISKDKKLDTQPKPPAYVRMVESQRDLLLKAVQELRQKSAASQQTGTTWDATSDINRVLQELGVHVDHSEVVRESIMEELAGPRPSSQDVNRAESSQHVPTQLGLKNESNKTSQSIDASAPNSSSTDPFRNQSQSQSQSQFAETTPDFEAFFNTDQHPFNDTPFTTDAHFNNPQFDKTMLTTDWPSPSLPYFDFNFQDPTRLDYSNTEATQHPQTGQFGNLTHDPMPDIS